MTGLEAVRYASALLELHSKSGPAMTPTEWERELAAAYARHAQFGWADFFRVTEEEARRRPPFLMHAPASYWIGHATNMAIFALSDYRKGEILLGRLMEIVHKCSLFCDSEVRAALLGWTAEQARTIRPRRSKGKKLGYPTSLRIAAVNVANKLRPRMQAENLPLRHDPRLADRRTMNVLREAIRHFPSLGLFIAEYPISETMLYEWYLEFNRRTGGAAPRGRPKKK